MNTAPKKSLTDSVQFLKGVGPARADLLANLNIRTVGDLLFHLPRYYDDLGDIRDMGQLTAGVLQTVRGEIVELDSKELPTGKRVLSVVVADAKGRCVEGVWFGQFFVAQKFRYGLKVAFSGKPKWFRDHWTMQHPRVEILEHAGDEPINKVVAVYPMTENLAADRLRDMVRAGLDSFGELVADILPRGLLSRHGLPALPQALEHAHFPVSVSQGLTAKRRFIYEEFLVLQIALSLRRRELRDARQAPKMPADAEMDARIRRLFPFTLTQDQDRSIAAICKDLKQDRPMQRLLQADVGAGKTAVAVYALLVAVANKHQAALMAPTEVLAQQHWNTLEKYLAQSRVRRFLLTGSLSAKERRQALEDIRAGKIDLVVGTQALVSQDVVFARLGLVVIDEQHKFGVSQRARIRKQEAGDPHYLVMTATPIPRTIALTVFGDLDISIIRQLPPGRQPVVTRWLTEKQRASTYQQLREQMQQGRQAYIVCPLVEESESLDWKAAAKMHADLTAGAFGGLRVGLLHGRLDDADKDRLMREFRDRKLDALVATVVIEVGVDVPNATLMVIEQAERFGLSQLHQLRGRISRGEVAGECYLFTGMPTEEARERLKIFTRTADGFVLAEEDARLRGLGELLGTRQHGLGDLRFGDPLADRELLETARADAIALVADDPELRKPEHALLRRNVLDRYGKTLALAEVG
ncbi:MAG: ATP-dependent DNA helicase RecG [Gemmataceae bacterium]|nr:ATP-dependent DNA helicase RecG [Gemmataceae bacterium]